MTGTAQKVFDLIIEIDSERPTNSPEGSEWFVIWELVQQSKNIGKPISETTARKALAELVQLGYAEKRPVSWRWEPTMFQYRLIA